MTRFIPKLLSVFFLEIFTLICVYGAELEKNEMNFQIIPKPDEHELHIRKMRQAQGGAGYMGSHAKTI
jgi:hypothetical protein